MTRFKSLFDDFIKKKGLIMIYRDNNKGKTKGFGTIKCKIVDFTDVP